MRILMLSQYYPPEAGATQTRMAHFGRHLVAQGHEVTVITSVPNHPKGVVFEGYGGKLIRRGSEDGIDVIRVWVAVSSRRSFLQRIAFYFSFMATSFLTGLLLVRGRFDVCLATSPPLPVAVSGWALARAKRCPFVMDVRDLWPAVAVSLGELSDPRMIRAAEAVERFLYRSAAAITCVTRGFITKIEGMGIDASKLHLVPNGTIPELFNPGRRDEALRGRLGLEGCFVAGFCGNHGLAQGLPAVLQAAALLAGEDRIRFLFVGEGPVKGQLLQMRLDLGLRNVLMLDEVPIGEIAAYVNACDVMLVPLRNDPIFATFIPSKAFDFMACARPMVISVDGEARRIVEEAGAGVYVEPEDPEALAGALRRLMDDPQALERMGASGRAYVLEHYLRERQSEHLEQILSAAAAPSPS